MTGNEFKSVMQSAAQHIIAAKEELTTIDSQFGDGDHGITMEKIAHLILKKMDDFSEGDDISVVLDELGTEILGVNGGSAGPLWGTYIGGLALGLPEGTKDLTVAHIQKMFQCALEEMYDISTARVGDKTMMDTLIPAAEAIISAQGDERKVLEAGKKAAIDGAKASEGFISKFGRAKSYKEKTIGTPDAGAVSMMHFFVGLCDGIK